MSEAAAETNGFESCGERDISAIAVALDGAFVAKSVSQRIVAKEIQQTVVPAADVPVIITGAAQGIVVDPEVTGLGGAMAWFDILDRRFIDLKLAGFENLGLDGLVDGFEVPGGGVGPSVEGLPPDVGLISSSEALGLAVMREVVGKFVDDDLCGERGSARVPGMLGSGAGAMTGGRALSVLCLNFLRIVRRQIISGLMTSSSS